MGTFLTVMSFPFWFVGILCLFGTITGTVHVNGDRAGPIGHLVSFFIGILLTFIAYCMTF
jgi:hypothetical protein